MFFNVFFTIFIKNSYKNKNWGCNDLSFDDEQIADEKSMASMKIGYAGVHGKQKIRTLSENKINYERLLEVWKNIKRADKFFEFLTEMVSEELKSFVKELKDVNQKELENLLDEYNSSENFNTQNPEIIMCPNSLKCLNRKMIENEIETVQKLFDLFIGEANEKTKNVIEKMIKRRLDILIKVFL